MFTHGGLSESDALHWNKDTYLRLGRVVFLLTSKDAADRREGYCEFFALRRSFMAAEWDEQIKRLDEFRKERGHRSLSEIVAEAMGQMVEHGRTLPAAQECAEMPAGETIVPKSETVRPAIEPMWPRCETKREAVEQLSLF
jgi:hypothetical protein